SKQQDESQTSMPYARPSRIESNRAGFILDDDCDRKRADTQDETEREIAPPAMVQLVPDRGQAPVLQQPSAHHGRYDHGRQVRAGIKDEVDNCVRPCSLPGSGLNESATDWRDEDAKGEYRAL